MKFFITLLSLIVFFCYTMRGKFIKKFTPSQQRKKFERILRSRRYFDEKEWSELFYNYEHLVELLELFQTCFEWPNYYFSPDDLLFDIVMEECPNPMALSDFVFLVKKKFDITIDYDTLNKACEHKFTLAQFLRYNCLVPFHTKQSVDNSDEK